MPPVTFKNLISLSGLLKLIHLILNAICFGILQHYTTSSPFPPLHGEGQYLILTSYSCLVATFFLFVAYVFEGEILQKTVFEIMYHLFGAVAYFTASVPTITLLFKLQKYSAFYKNLPAFWVAAVCGLLNSVVYFVSSIVAFRLSRRVEGIPITR